MTIDEAETFLSTLRWQYAKTYPHCPHEYTCLAWSPEIQQQMIEFASLIQNEGYTEKWGKRENKVLNIGEMKYWTMDFPLETTDLINRAYADEDLRAQLAKFVQSEDFTFKRGMSIADVREQMANVCFKERMSDSEFYEDNNAIV